MSTKINELRMQEIATMVLHYLFMLDIDAAHRFLLHEVEMSEEEAEYLGVNNLRTVSEIMWDEDDKYFNDNLPAEVEIPWDVEFDDIVDYLKDEYKCNVIDFYGYDEDSYDYRR